MEGAAHGLAFASGSATTATIAALLKAGEHLISVDDVYGGTNRYFNRVAKPTMNLDITFVDFNEPGALEAAIKPNTKVRRITHPSAHRPPLLPPPPSPTLLLSSPPSPASLPSFLPSLR